MRGDLRSTQLGRSRARSHRVYSHARTSRTPQPAFIEPNEGMNEALNRRAQSAQLSVPNGSVPAFWGDFW